MIVPHTDPPREMHLPTRDAIDLLVIIQKALGGLRDSLPHDAEELAQDAFVKLLERFAAGGTIRELRLWARQIARDVRAEFFRKKARRERLLAPVEGFFDAIDTSDGAAEGVESGVAPHRALAEQLWPCFDRLDDSSQVLIRALYFNGLTQQEVADQLGSTRGSVAHQHRRTLNALRRMLSVSA